jgi:hypothetical protein
MPNDRRHLFQTAGPIVSADLSARPEISPHRMEDNGAMAMGIPHSGGSALLAALVVAAGIALATGAAGQTPADPPPEFVQVPLTGAMIQSFIASYPTVKAKTGPIIAKYNITAAAGLDDDTAKLTLNAARSQLNATASIYGGYPDYQAWINIAMSVASAMQRAAGDKQADPVILPPPMPGPGARSPPLPIPQVAAATPPPDANVEAVRPYVAQLQALLKP